MKRTAERALVTGGAGFVGSALVDRLLAEGYDVDVVDDLSSGTLTNLATARNSGGAFRFHRVDVRSQDLTSLVLRRRPHIIFHLAAQSSSISSHADPVEDAQINVIGSLRVLESARAAAVDKVIFSARAPALYGKSAATLPLSENALPSASPIDASRKAVLDYLAMYRQVHGLEFTALLLGDVYGSQRDPHARGSVVSAFSDRIACGKPGIIEGDGEQTRDFVFIDDVVDAFARAAKRGTGLVANIGTGIETSINVLYSKMTAIAGVKLTPINRADRERQVRRRGLDVSRAKIRLGWQPFTSLDEGLHAIMDSDRSSLFSGNPHS